MSGFDDRQLARLLRAKSAPQPPPQLLERLQRDIPAQIPVPPTVARWLPFERPLSSQLLAAAATVVVLLTSGSLAWLVVVENHVGIGGVEEPRPPAEQPVFFVPESSPPRAPVAARVGSAEAPQLRDLRALGYAGAAPSAAAPAPAPAYPGRFVDGVPAPGARSLAFRPQRAQPRAPEYEANLPGASAAGGVDGFAGATPRHAPPTAPPATAPEQASRGEVARTTAEAPLLDERRPAVGAASERREQPQAAADNEVAAPVAKAAAASRAAATGASAQQQLEADAPLPPPPLPLVPRAEAASRKATGTPTTIGAGRLRRRFVDRPGGSAFADAERERRSAFPLDADSSAYDLVRADLDAGRLPPAEAVRVGELVNAFDYGESAGAEGEVTLSAEGAPDPWAPSERYLLVRLAVRAGGPHGVGGARAEVEIDPRSVSRWRRLGADEGVPDGRTGEAGGAGVDLAAGQMASAIYELQLRPGAPAASPLLSLSVRWRATDRDGTPRASLVLRRDALAASWSSASRSFHLATVVARFGELLRGAYWAGDPSDDELDELALRAAALSREWPRQARVRELERLVLAARGLRRSGGGRP